MSPRLSRYAPHRPWPAIIDIVCAILVLLGPALANSVGTEIETYTETFSMSTTTQAQVITATDPPVSYINLGPLLDFTRPASCDSITAFLALNTGPSDSAQTLTDTDIPGGSTQLFGAAFAWSGFYDLQRTAYDESVTIPPSDCVPTSFFAIPYLVGPNDDYAASTYYSPAPVCPTGWTVASIGSSTLLVTATETATETVTETAAVCCPAGGWVVDLDRYVCSRTALTYPVTVGAHFSYGSGSITQSPLTFSQEELSPEELDGVLPVQEVPISIRWQASDVVATTPTGASETGSSTAHSTASVPAPTQKSGASANREYIVLLRGVVCGVVLAVLL
jgi:hypothetical protein